MTHRVFRPGTAARAAAIRQAPLLALHLARPTGGDMLLVRRVFWEKNRDVHVGKFRL
jgi:hypothetical protein